MPVRFVMLCLLLVTSVSHATTKIINGTPAVPGQFPFFVGLTAPESGEYGDYWCGGTLISADTILTAAHCVDNEDYHFVAHIGMMQKLPLVATESIPVKQIIVHPDWMPSDPAKTGLNDIALLKLATPAKTTDYALLDEINTDIGATVTTAGMGLDENNNYTNQLLYAQAVVLDWHTACDNYPAGYPPTHFNPELHLCTSVTDRGGDSGGPKMNRDSEGKYHQVGIVSRTLPNADQSTRVAGFSDWIQDNL